MEKKRLTDKDVTTWARRLLLQLVSEVDIRDRQKVMYRMLEIEQEHVANLNATFEATKKKEG